VAIGDRVRTVGIVRKGGLLHVELDGRHACRRRAAGINESVISLLVQLEGQADSVAVRRRRVRVEVVERRFRRAPRRPDHRGGDSPGRLIRPPAEGRSRRPGIGPAARRRAHAGKVVRILVKPGDEVKARQGLVVSKR
jgi:biotin carboxyl carrier protein